MPNKLKKCQVCGSYTLKSEHCKKEVKDAHYKFIKIRDVKFSDLHTPQGESPQRSEELRSKRE